MSQSGTPASSLPRNIAKRFRASREKRGQQDDYWDEVLEKKKAAEERFKEQKRLRFAGVAKIELYSVEAKSHTKAFIKPPTDDLNRQAEGGLERYELVVHGGVFISGRRPTKKRKQAAEVQASNAASVAAAEKGDPALEDAPSAELQRFKMAALYERHNPTKVNEVDSLLERYAGRYSAMWAKLEEKYGAAAVAAAHEAALVQDAMAAANVAAATAAAAAVAAKRRLSQTTLPKAAPKKVEKKKRQKDIVRVRVKGQVLTPKKKKVKKDLSYSKWRSMSKNERKAFSRP
jgi:hypothetical protein